MAEPDQPSTARMIDHLLGGEHHFPVEVAAALAFEELCAPVFRALRDFLGRAVGAIAGSGVDSFVVFGRWRPTAEGTLPIQVWRPDGPPAEVPDAFYGAVATKPLS